MSSFVSGGDATPPRPQRRGQPQHDAIAGLREKLASRRLNETKLREDGGEARLPIAARSDTMEGIVAAYTADKDARTGAEKVQLQNLFTNGLNFSDMVEASGNGRQDIKESKERIAAAIGEDTKLKGTP